MKREGEDTIGNTSKREGDISKYGQKDGKEAEEGLKS